MPFPVPLQGLCNWDSTVLMQSRGAEHNQQIWSTGCQPFKDKGTKGKYTHLVSGELYEQGLSAMAQLVEVQRIKQLGGHIDCSASHNSGLCICPTAWVCPLVMH